MKLKSDRPFGINQDFICMGMVGEGLKEYACLLQRSTNQLYIEEIHWAFAGSRNFFTATLHQIDSDDEWKNIYSFVTKSTTIFSPAKISDILKRDPYTYNKEFMKTEEFKRRKKELRGLK